jgi:hypothetical protein
MRCEPAQITDASDILAILTAYRLDPVGVTTFRISALAGDVGRGWSWNRGPGIQCDNDAYRHIRLLENPAGRGRNRS